MKIVPERIRPPAVAGVFYPATPSRLAQTVDDFLAQARVGSQPERTPKALIAPHAGYSYSGPVAGSAFQAVVGNGSIQRVILLGPAHYQLFRGIAWPQVTAFATPLGLVPLDHEVLAKVAHPALRRHDGAHCPEHCLEVELPFLQRCLDRFSIVPLLVGDATDEEISAVLDCVWGGADTLVVVSSDLSHDLEYEQAVATDRQTAHAIRNLDADGIGPEAACGHAAIRGLVRAARFRGLHAAVIDLRNSGDSAGSRERVVGYGAFSFCSSELPDHLLQPQTMNAGRQGGGFETE